MSGKVALVTGASRGIGKASAVALAEAGFDIAVAARTIHEGDGVDDTRPGRRLPGSLDGTVAAIEAIGRQAVAVPLDLRERSTWSPAVEAVLDRWGRIDVLVNNGRYQALDHAALLLDVSVESLDAELEANLLAPVVLTKLVLPSMLEQGGGTIVNLTSTAGYMTPPEPSGRGGWSTSYALVKGGLHRLAGMIALELGDDGIKAFNLQPGFVVTERNEAIQDEIGTAGRYVGAPPSAIGPVVAWLATDHEAAELNGKTIEAQFIALSRGLAPDWRSDPNQAGSIGPQVEAW